MSSETIPVTLDAVSFDRKPQRGEIAGITRRLQAGGHVCITPQQFAQAVADGRTWAGGCYKPANKGWGEFIGQRLFAIDIDNDTAEVGEDGSKTKRALLPNERGYLDPWAALDRWRQLFGREPFAMYPTFSYRFGGTVPDLESTETRMKYRVVLDAGEFVTSEGRARDVLKKLLRAFPEADTACKNPNRLYFGSCGRVVIYTEGRPHYVKRS